MIEFICDTNGTRVSRLVLLRYPMISYSHLMSLFRKKDVMVNGKRIKEDIAVKIGDSIRIYTDVYTSDTYKYNVETEYEDDNIIIFWKPKGLETEGDISLSAYAKTICPDSFACHRLDVNTDGFVIFAKGEIARKAVVKAMNEGGISKYYLAALYGKLERPYYDIKAYIKKDKDASHCVVVDKKQEGALPIRTVVKEIAYLNGFTLAEIKLFTGRTHQIRAQMANIKHYVLGDGKYCPMSINKQFSFKKQALSAYKLVFESDSDILKSLKGRTFVHKCGLSDILPE